MLNREIIRPSFWSPGTTIRAAAIAVIALIGLGLSTPGNLHTLLANRRPLVLVNGQVAQLPSGDTLTTDGLTATSFSDTGSFALTGSIAPAALAGTVNDYNPAGLATTNLIRQDASVASTITGLVAQATGTEIVIQNISATNTITLSNEGAGSTAANRFTLPNAQDWIIPPGGAIWLRYSGSATRWKPAAGPNGAVYAQQFTNVGPEVQNAVISPTALVGPSTVNDWAPTGFATARTIRVTLGSGDVTITGLAGGACGRVVEIVALATDSSRLVLASQNVGSSAANRFRAFGSDTKLVGVGATARLEYDCTSSRWQVEAITSGTSAIDTVSGLQTNGLFQAAASILQTTVTLPTSTTPTAISGTLNNYSPTQIGAVSVLRQDVSSAATITGLDPAINTGSNAGRLLLIENIATTVGDTITLTNEDAGSTAADRFTLPNAASWVISPGGAVILRYSGTASRWIIEGGTGNGSAGTGNVTATSLTPNKIPKATGALAIGDSACSDNATTFACSEAMAATFSPTNNANSRTVFASTSSGTYNSTSGALTEIGVDTSATGTRASGANPVNNIGLRTTASGGQSNISFETLAGDILLTQTSGNVYVGGTAPTLSACGTTPSNTGAHNNAGIVTVGTGGGVTACTVTFANGGYTATPTCTLSAEFVPSGAGGQIYFSAKSSTAFTIGTTGTDLSGLKFDYVCVGI